MDHLDLILPQPEPQVWFYYGLEWRVVNDILAPVQADRSEIGPEAFTVKERVFREVIRPSRRTTAEGYVIHTYSPLRPQLHFYSCDSQPELVTPEEGDIELIP